MNYFKKSALFIPSAFFFVICYHFTSLLNLWGDEACSLKLAEMPLQDILRTADVHAPTYYFLLKLIINFIASTYQNEVVIRLIHAVIFLGGLFFGWKILISLQSRLRISDRVVMFIMLFIILNPSYSFYATNIRMYAFYYLFSMWYIYAVFKYLKQSSVISIKNNWDILLSGSLLVSLDYMSLVYYCLGVAVIYLKARGRLNGKLILFTCVPLLFLLAYVPILMPSIKMLFAWPTHSISISKTVPQHFLAILNQLFSSGRPFLELTNLSFKIIVFPLITLLLYAVFFLIGVSSLLKRCYQEKDLCFLFILLLSFVWLMTFFLGASLTRIFLPSQFFISVLIVYGLSDVNSEYKSDSKHKMRFYFDKYFQWLRHSWIKGIFYIGLIFFNFYLAVFPVTRFTSGIPYRAIAQDVMGFVHQTQINTILISGNSLNSESILRYLNQISDNKIEIRILNPQFTSQDIPRKPFLFLSYMDENNQFIDPMQFTLKFHRHVRALNNYVKLNALEYNTLWKNHIINRTQQFYAYSLYQI